MGILIQYLLHFSVPILIHFTNNYYLALIPWIGSIAFSLLFRGKKDFFPKKPTFDLILGGVAIVVSITIATYIVYSHQMKNIPLDKMEYFFLELWKLTPLFFMIHHPFIFGKNDSKSNNKEDL